MLGRSKQLKQGDMGIMCLSLAPYVTFQLDIGTIFSHRGRLCRHLSGCRLSASVHTSLC